MRRGLGVALGGRIICTVLFLGVCLGQKSNLSVMDRIRDDRAIPLLKLFMIANCLLLVCLSLLYHMYNRLPMEVPDPDAVNSVTKRTSESIDLLRNIDNSTGIGTCAGPNCKNDSLIRFGNQLNFDYGTCLASALMRHKSTKRVPLHDDCPKVFLVGTRKGGTTSLIKYLSAHPDFSGANINLNGSLAYHVGETDYFSVRYSPLKWKKYKAQFVGDGHVLGDSSVSNFMDCRVPARIYTSCGDSMKSMKFIILLRDPVERFQSNYQFRVHYNFTGYNRSQVNISYFVNKEIKNFHNALLKRRLNPNTAQNHLNNLLCMFKPGKNTIYEGLYPVHVHHWLCNVPAENILIINSEEFFQYTADMLSKVIHFIGLSPLSNKKIASIVSQKYNVVTSKLQSQHWLSQSERQRIKDLYQPFNLKILDMLHWPHTLWS